MNKKIKRLEDLIELYKSNTITKEEYEDLKKELFLDSNVKVNNDSIKPKIANKISETNKTQNNYQKETFYSSNKWVLNPMFIILTIVFLYLYINNNKNVNNESAIEEYNTSTSATINDVEPINEETISEEHKMKCYMCKGTGIIICSMCGGTGVNNMGTVCGCVAYVRNCELMGRTPTKTALQWTCGNCHGTGYLN